MGQNRMLAQDKLGLELRRSSDSNLLDETLLALYAKMTATEKKCRKAIRRNGAGFDQNAAGPMCTFARLLLAGKLTNKHRKMVRRMVCRFSGQLRSLALKHGFKDDRPRIDQERGSK